MWQSTARDVNAIHANRTRGLREPHMLSQVAASSYERRDDEGHNGSSHCAATPALIIDGGHDLCSGVARGYALLCPIWSSHAAKRGCFTNLTFTTANSCWKTGRESTLSISGSLIFQIPGGMKPWTLSSKS
ncbi:hypothetical protein V5279_37875 [Bradyrhizobium sp. 26S5]|uniref:hypothetical protein n=1 Tax=Bradyrhizobium sp. 26S5 TaxID=3139729 RepID=UPI0030D13F84